MTAVLGHSRRLYCRAFLAQQQDDWLEGLEGAFQHFGGLTEQVLCDNASPLVTSHDRQSGQVVWNPGFETFCRDRGLTDQSLSSPSRSNQGEDRTGSWLRQAQRTGRSLVRFLRGSAVSPGSVDGRGRRRADPWHNPQEKPSVRFERDERQPCRTPAGTPSGRTHSPLDTSRQCRLLC